MKAPYVRAANSATCQLILSHHHHALDKNRQVARLFWSNIGIGPESRSSRTNNCFNFPVLTVHTTQDCNQQQKNKAIPEKHGHVRSKHWHQSDDSFLGKQYQSVPQHNCKSSCTEAARADDDTMLTLLPFHQHCLQQANAVSLWSEKCDVSTLQIHSGPKFTKCSGNIHKLWTSKFTLYSKYKELKSKQSWYWSEECLGQVVAWEMHITRKECMECRYGGAKFWNCRFERHLIWGFRTVWHRKWQNNDPTKKNEGTDPKVVVSDDVQYIVKENES